MTNPGGCDLVRLDVPVDADLAEKLVSFWEDTFECSFAWLSKILSGSEIDSNKDILFVALDGDRPVSSCRLTICLGNRKLALLGDVATSPSHRGRGFARTLCRWALDEFRIMNGEAVFLATSNPAAAVLYSSLGWHKLAGSNVMLNVLADATPEEYMVDLYRSGKDLPVKINNGSAANRVSIVPLILTPLDQHILDWNTSLYSIRYQNQPGCEGLYSRYEALKGRGVWYVAQRCDGVVAGISSAGFSEDGSICVDAFAHSYHENECICDLYEQAIKWAKSHNAEIFTACSTSDIHKKRLLSSLECLSGIAVRDIID